MFADAMGNTNSNLGKVYMRKIFQLVAYSLGQMIEPQKRREQGSENMTELNKRGYGVFQNYKNRLLFKKCDSLKGSFFLINEMRWLC